MTESEYLSPQWSNALELIALQRAIEAYDYNLGHTRPNGDSCWTAQYNGIGSWGEILAWGPPTMPAGPSSVSASCACAAGTPVPSTANTATTATLRWILLIVLPRLLIADYAVNAIIEPVGCSTILHPTGVIA